MEVDAQTMTMPLSSVLLWLAAGTLVGALNWLSLRWTAEMLASGRSWARALTLQMARFAALGTVLAVVAIRGGALALLLSTGGLLVARAVVLRLVARE